MKLGIEDIFKKIENSEFTRRDIPGPTKEEMEDWNNQALVLDMAIDTRFMSVRMRDLTTLQWSQLSSYWRGSAQIGRQVLSFDPQVNKRGFYLYGVPGVGKTSILKALAISLAKRFRGQVKCIQLKQALDAMTQDDFKNKDEISYRISNARFLFIDDIGIERNSEWTREQIYTILDNRLFSEDSKGNPRFTFFSSNLTIRQLNAKFHERDLRRLRDMAEFIEVRREFYR